MAMQAGVTWGLPSRRMAMEAGVTWGVPARRLAMGRGVTWGLPSRRMAIGAGGGRGLPARVVVAAFALGMSLLVGLLPISGHSAPADALSVIVRSIPGGLDAAERALTSLGGTVLTRMDALDSMHARVPAAAVDTLSAAASVQGV